MRTAVFLVLALVMPLCLAADSSEAPFKHPRAVQAWNRFKFRENKAKELYEREMAAAKAEYTAGLKEAATLAAKAGDAEDLKAIAEAQKESPKIEVTNRQWIRHLANGQTLRVYFNDDGGITLSGPSEWANWKLDGDRLIINQNRFLTLKHVPAFVGQDASGPIYVLPVSE